MLPLLRFKLWSFLLSTCPVPRYELISSTCVLYMPSDSCFICSACVNVPVMQEEALSCLGEWLTGSAFASNQMLLVVAGTIYIHEQNYNEALRHTQAGGDLEL